MTDPNAQDPKPYDTTPPYPTPPAEKYPSSQPADQYPSQGSSPYPAQAPYSLGVTESPKIVLSLIGMILGILGVLSGFFGWGLLFAIGAAVLGHMGHRREPWAKGFWLTALITGYVGIAINVVVLLFAVIFTLALFGAATTGA